MVSSLSLICYLQAILCCVLAAPVTHAADTSDADTQRGPLQGLLGKICLGDQDCATDEQCQAPFSGALSGLPGTGRAGGLLAGFSLISVKVCGPRLTPPGFHPSGIAAEQAQHYVLPPSDNIYDQSRKPPVAPRTFQNSRSPVQVESFFDDLLDTEERHSEQLAAGAFQGLAGVASSLGRALPTGLLDGVSITQAPIITCRAFQRDLFVGEVTTINARGFTNDLFNVTLLEPSNPDSVLIHVKELQTLSKVPGVFQFSCDTPGVFKLKFKVFATDLGGGILGKGFKLCKGSISKRRLRPPFMIFPL
eukprot:Blabericola_migrator_1__111@NODE_1028_length_5664_cov_44_189566_g708_i0_p3_GENE_NODE_1028_length_5664_cov_44_189566_g708_i0NODE_1028_length_5664_cov_44_189566_g708_i0_p3_ORF_typecomplete_len306_score29_48_NODE_1028_length_5664_cov_44_189566_g708_i023423259